MASTVSTPHVGTGVGTVFATISHYAARTLAGEALASVENYAF